MSDLSKTTLEEKAKTLALFIVHATRKAFYDESDKVEKIKNALMEFAKEIKNEKN